MEDQGTPYIPSPNKNGASEWNRTTYLILTKDAHILMCFTGMGPKVGLEPTTYRLQGECSAIELLRHKKLKAPDLGALLKLKSQALPYVHTPPVVHGVAVGVAVMNFIISKTV